LLNKGYKFKENVEMLLADFAKEKPNKHFVLGKVLFATFTRIL
jgi:hypothetical protein